MQIKLSHEFPPAKHTDFARFSVCMFAKHESE